MAAGRPSTFNAKIAEQVCQAIETTPKGLKWIIEANSKFPPIRTFYDWLERDEALSQRYRRARERQAELLVDETLEIADDTSEDTKIVGGEDNEREAANSEWIQRSKVRIETRFKLASKLNPKKWGDKITNEHTGPDGGPIETITRKVIDPKAE